MMLKNDGTEEFWAGEPWRVWVTDQANGAGQTILTLELCAGKEPFR
jgi:hypothetical protein